MTRTTERESGTHSVLVAAHVPPDLARALRAIADREERSVSYVVRKLIEERVAAEGSWPRTG